MMRKFTVSAIAMHWFVISFSNVQITRILHFSMAKPNFTDVSKLSPLIKVSTKP